MATVKKRKEKKSVYEGNVYIQATFNNTIVTITDLKGNAIAWASSGDCNDSIIKRCLNVNITFVNAFLFLSFFYCSH